MSAPPVHGKRPSQWDVFRMMNGVLLNTPEKAVEFTETVVRVQFGQVEVEAERPFVAVDKGDTWEVRGTRESPYLTPALSASCIVTLRKSVGEIVDFEIVTSKRAPTLPP